MAAVRCASAYLTEGAVSQSHRRGVAGRQANVRLSVFLSREANLYPRRRRHSGLLLGQGVPLQHRRPAVKIQCCSFSTASSNDCHSNTFSETSIPSSDSSSSSIHFQPGPGSDPGPWYAVEGATLDQLQQSIDADLISLLLPAENNVVVKEVIKPGEKYWSPGLDDESLASGIQELDVVAVPEETTAVGTQTLVDGPPKQLAPGPIAEPVKLPESPTLEKPEAAAMLVRRHASEQTVLEQIKMVLSFAGPALGIWLANPLMSLIDTAVIGNSSSLELAALGPATVVCDQISYMFMFISVATSNLIATAMANEDLDEAARHLSRLLFVGLACGVGLIAFTRFFSVPILRAFVGAKNANLIPAANTYAQIRGYAWPAVLVGSVAQSASLGMQNAWGPLKVLALASLINLVGDLVLCPVLGMGIAGAAWATMASQYVGCALLLLDLHNSKTIPLAISIPKAEDFLMFIHLAAPILLSMIAKVTFYTILTYIATSLGTVPIAAHQVMIGLYSLFCVVGEPLSQTSQSFMPTFTTGVHRNLKQARQLLRSLLGLAVTTGAFMGACAAAVPWVAPQLFTADAAIVSRMRTLTAPLHVALMLTPVVLVLEGTLLAGRDLKFLAIDLLTSLAICVFFLVMGQKLGMGLVANWWTLVAFQGIRLTQAGLRLLSSKSILADKSTIGLRRKLHLA
eukprot:SM000040S14765  [mRNA]  locus=s40:216939:221821:+ [translate_table: standard]